jgi:uncharacterized protein
LTQSISFQRFFSFFLSRIFIGIFLIGAAVALTVWAGKLLLSRLHIYDPTQDQIVGVIVAAVALLSYQLLFRFYEKRIITELSIASLPANSLMGFFIGIFFQSLIILVAYAFGDYFIIKLNPASFALPGFIMALTAGFVAEILIRGIFFRIVEEKIGTVYSILLIVFIFIIIHAFAKNATLLSVCATAAEGGFLISAVYVYSRSLWFPIFLHFAWDFAEPAIYGGINPGISLQKSLFTSSFTGSPLVTGGQAGPGNSIQSLILCLLTGALFLWLAWKKNNFIKPYSKRIM